MPETVVAAPAVTFVERDVLPPAPPEVDRWWQQARVDTVTELTAPDSTAWNGTAMLLTDVSCDGDGVTLGWARGEYADMLTAIAMPATLSAQAPLWMRTVTTGVIAPALCADGWVWMRRSQRVRVGRGLWQPGPAEGIEVADADAGDLRAVGTRALAEELGVHLPAAELQVAAAYMQESPAGRVRLAFYVPADLSHMTLDELETSSLSAPDRWEFDELTTTVPPQRARVSSALNPAEFAWLHRTPPTHGIAA